MTLEVCWDGLWTLSFGLSQCHGHGSWLVYEAALRYEHKTGLIVLCGTDLLSITKALGLQPGVWAIIWYTKD